MKNQLKQVREFEDRFHRPVKDEPTIIPQEGYFLRHNLMKEENTEYLHACMSGDLSEIADALGDKLYILLGTVIEHGLQKQFEDIFSEIHASNMTKLEDGKPIIRDDGKILKGKNFRKPDFSKILEKYLK